MRWLPLLHDDAQRMLRACLRDGHTFVWRDDIRDYACDRCHAVRALCIPTARDRVVSDRPA